MFGLNSGEEFLYIRLANYILVLSVFLLWIGLLLVGMVARRFQKVLQVSTRWFFMMFAPTGLFLYGLLTLYATVIQGMIKMPLDLAFIAYILFALGGILTFISFYQFNRVIKRG